MAIEAVAYDQDRTVIAATPADRSYRVLAAAVGETRVLVGDDMVSIRAGEDVMVENGRIIAPKRILDERRADLARRLAPLSKERK